MGKIAQAISHLLVAIVDLENLKGISTKKAKIAHATKKMDECITAIIEVPSDKWDEGDKEAFENLKVQEKIVRD